MPTSSTSDEQNIDYPTLDVQQTNGGIQDFIDFVIGLQENRGQQTGRSEAHESSWGNRVLRDVTGASVNRR